MTSPVRTLLVLFCVAVPSAGRSDGTTDPDDVLDPYFRFAGGAAGGSAFDDAPTESIDPFSGNLSLVHTDLILPGRAGMDLTITRSYSSKIWTRADWVNESALIPQFRWVPLGYGWSFHFGQLRNAQGPNQTSLCPTDYPTFEEPDGTTHQFYPTPGDWNTLRSKDQWKMVRYCASGVPYCIYSSSGTRYEFGVYGIAGDVAPLWQPTTIRDAHNNTIQIEYQPVTPCTPGGVCALGIVKKVTDTVGRIVTFTYDSSKQRITAMWVNGKQYQYKYTTYTVNGAPVSFLTEVVPPAGPSWKYSYNTTGPQQGLSANNRWAVEKVTYPAGATLSYQYLATKFHAGPGSPPPNNIVYFLPVTKKTQAGRAVPSATWSFAYNSSPYNTGGDVTTITRPDGKQDVYTLFGYAATGSNNLWKVGLTKQVSYGSGARLETFVWNKDPSPISSDIVYAPDYVADGVCNLTPSDPDVFVARLGSRTIQQDGKSYATTYSSYDAYQQPTSVTETGHATRTRALTYFYLPALNMLRGRTASEQVCVGGCFTSSWSYSSVGDRTAETRSGVTTSYTYDAKGRLTRITDALGAKLDLTWTGLSPEYGVPVMLVSSGGGVSATRTRTVSWEGRILSETDPNGHITNNSYDPIGRPTAIDHPAGCDETVSYASDDSSMVNSRCSLTVTTSLDGLARPTLTADSLGVKISTTYNAMGLTSFQSYPYDVTVAGDTFVYDPLARVTKTTHADGTYVQTTYAANYVDTRNERAFTTRFFHQAFGDPGEVRLISVLDPLGNTTSYTYDAYGSTLSVNAPGTTGDRSYSYDSHHYLVSENNPETGAIIYGRNLLGQQTSRQDARGTATVTLDGLHRVIGIDFPGGSGDDVSFTRDPTGQVTMMMTTSGGRFDYTYDGGDRLTKQRWTYAGRQYSTDYTYLNDCLTAVDHPTDWNESRTCDAGGRLTGINGFLSNVAYHPSGQMKTFKLGDGKTTNVTFDSRGRVIGVAAAGVVTLSFGFDAGGNVTSYQNVTTGASKSMTYDSIDRLLTASGPWGAASYTYDPLGNRTQKNVAGAITNYTYHATTGRLASASGDEPGTWTWDPVGNLLAGGGFDYTWDHGNRMVTSSDGSTYKYDGLGRRVSKTSPAGGTILYHRDQDGHVISETRPDGTVLRDFVYAGQRLIAMFGQL